MKHLIFLSLLFFSCNIFSQNGGEYSFEFLNLTYSSRINALGGHNISIHDNDISAIEQNPAMLKNNYKNSFSTSYINYFSDINYGNANYAFELFNGQIFMAGINYINYGNFTETDETGKEIGSFSANDYNIHLNWAHKIDSNLNLGLQLNNSISAYYGQNAYALSIDAGVYYYNPKSLFSIAAVIKNAGLQLKSYRPNNREPLHIDATVGLTKKLKHAPLAFSITGINLFDPKLDYVSTLETNDNELINGEVIKETKSQKIGEKADNLLRHVVVGAQIIPFKSFYASFGYNFKRRKDLAIESKPGIVGLSWGLGINLKKVTFSFSRSRYHLAGASNNFTLSLNINEF